MIQEADAPSRAVSRQLKKWESREKAHDLGGEVATEVAPVGSELSLTARSMASMAQFPHRR